MIQEITNRCPTCAAPLSATARFCPACGTSVAAAAPIPQPVAALPPCWYCGLRPAERGAEADFEMHADVTRNRSLYGTGIRTTTRWRSLSVPIPRCGVCARSHKVSRRLKTAGFWLGFLLGLPIFLLFAAGLNSGTGILLGAVLGWPGALLWGRLLGGWYGNRRGRGKGCRPYAAGAAFPPVQQKIREGWRAGKPFGVR